MSYVSTVYIAVYYVCTPVNTVGMYVVYNLESTGFCESLEDGPISIGISTKWKEKRRQF